MTEPCNREGYGSSGVHAPTDFTVTDTHIYGTCYNCKRPVRALLNDNYQLTWTILGAYLVVEWP